MSKEKKWGWRQVVAVVGLTLICQYAIYVLYTGIHEPGPDVVQYGGTIQVGEQSQLIGGGKYFIYAGMINDSVFSVLYSGKFNLYYPITVSTIKVGTSIVNVTEVKQKSLCYQVVVEKYYEE